MRCRFASGPVLAQQAQLEADVAALQATPAAFSQLLVTPASTVALPMNPARDLLAEWTTHAGDETVVISGSHSAGQRLACIITNDAGLFRTVTFGTGFKSIGSIVGTTSKTATILFVSDGTRFWEVSRTLAIV